MSQHFFAVHSGEFGQKLKGGKTAAAKMDAIARQISPDAGYNYYYAKGEQRWYGHGYCRNLGSPFDGRTASRIEAAWLAAGL